MRNLLVVIVALSMLALGNSSAHARRCWRPDPPSCLDYYGTFEDDFSFENCKREMESYLDEVTTYQECLQKDINEIADEANEQIKKFNCKASGESFCP